mgnify:CR=1 FL=1
MNKPTVRHKKWEAVSDKDWSSWTWQLQNKIMYADHLCSPYHFFIFNCRITKCNIIFYRTAEQENILQYHSYPCPKVI